MLDKTLVKFFYYFYKVLGLMPIQFGNTAIDKKTPRKRFIYSRRNLLYNIFLTFFVAGLNYYSIRTSYESYEFYYRVKFERIIDTIMTVFGLFCATFTLITFCVHCKQSVKIANEILILEQSISRINEKMYTKNMKLSHAILKIFLIHCITRFFVIFSVDTQKNNEIVMFYVGAYVCDMINNCTLIQYSMIMKLMEQLFKVINENCIYMSKESASSVNITCICQNSCSTCEQIKAEKIVCLHELHLSICEILQILSNLYMKLMFFCTTYTFLDLIVSAYYVVKPLVNGEDGLWSKIYFHTVCHIVHSTVMMVILTKSVTEATSEVKAKHKD